jgi:hypothetical protein
MRPHEIGACSLVHQGMHRDKGTSFGLIGMGSRVAGTGDALAGEYLAEAGTSLSVAGVSDGEAIASRRVFGRWVEEAGHWLQVRGT